MNQNYFQFMGVYARQHGKWYAHCTSHQAGVCAYEDRTAAVLAVVSVCVIKSAVDFGRYVNISH